MSYRTLISPKLVMWPEEHLAIAEDRLRMAQAMLTECEKHAKRRGFTGERHERCTRTSRQLVTDAERRYAEALLRVMQNDR